MDNEYSQKQSILFTPASIGPITLRNRTIRSAAFEGMCDHNAPTEMLYDYHRSVAAGGIGMTTLAYASVTRNGLSFKHQLWMRPEIVKPLRRITECHSRRGSQSVYSTGTLRQYVAPQHSRPDSHIGIDRIQPLFPHICERNA